MEFHYTFVLFVVFSLLSVLSSAPITNKNKEKEDAVELYDQRQNGTENYHIRLKDVVIILSPLETILPATFIAQGLLENHDSSQLGGIKNKPKGKNKRWTQARFANLIKNIFVRKHPMITDKDTN